MARTMQLQVSGAEEGAVVGPDVADETMRHKERTPALKSTLRVGCVAGVTLSTLLLAAIIVCSLTHVGLAVTFFVQQCVVHLVSMMLIAVAGFAVVVKMLCSLRPHRANDPNSTSADARTAAALQVQQRRESARETMVWITVAVILVWIINAAFVDTADQAATFADDGKKRALAALEYVNCRFLGDCSVPQVRDNVIVVASSEAIYVATNPDGSACRGALNSTNDVIHYMHCLLRDVGKTETTERIDMCACEKSLRSLQLCLLGSTLHTLALKDRAVAKIASCALKIKQ